MLDKNKFVLKEQTKMLSAKGVYDIIDADSNQPLGTAAPTKSGFMKTIMGLVLGKDNMSLTIEFRQKSDNALLFSVRRKGLLFKKVQALDAQGQVLGSYKAKKFSLSGGFHIYDKDGKHFAEIKGKMFKSDYKFLTPDGKEMGTVSKTWGGMAKELLTSAGTHVVVIAPAYATDTTAKKLVLGAAIAINTAFKKKGGKGGGGESEESGGDE